MKAKLFVVCALLVVGGLLGLFFWEEDDVIVRQPAAEATYTLMGHTFPLHPLEIVPQEEAASIEGTNQVIGEFFRRHYSKPEARTDRGAGIKLEGTRRGVHPKAHGCIQGSLKVAGQLEKKDQVGIFQKLGHEYKVLARFSNGDPRGSEDDTLADSRGFGLKVYGVEGEMLLKNAIGQSGPATQEFNMNSSATFFADTAKTYRRFMEVALLESKDSSNAVTNYLIDLVKKLQVVTAKRALSAFLGIQAVKATNPLSLRYWSISPFQHGEGPAALAVKYSLAPCDGVWTEQIDPKEPNFLRRHLREYISKKSACFRFMIQDRIEDANFNVENPMRLWDEKKSPFREVARVEFPPQSLMDEMTCEKEVINPWNTLPAHKPIGGINRLRLAAYLMSIESRKRTNQY